MPDKSNTDQKCAIEIQINNYDYLHRNDAGLKIDQWWEVNKYKIEVQHQKVGFLD